jgi:tyrosine decarboxylase/aspartate 1-decarboxylase
LILLKSSLEISSALSGLDLKKKKTAILFRNEEHLKLAGWSASVSGWTYTTPGLLGTRPGTHVAVTWALFNYLGREGYMRLSKKCMDLTMNFVEGVRRIPGLDSATVPKVNIATTISTSFNMDPVKKKLKDRGWFFWDANGSPMTRENAIAVGLVPYHQKAIPAFLKDLKDCAAEGRG